MTRYLFVVPPLVGHIAPNAAVAAELAGRGHDVAWSGHLATVERVAGAGATVFPAVDDDAERRIRAERERWLRLRGPAELKFLWEEFIVPLGRAMLPATRAAIQRYEPDVVVCDQQAIAGPVAAHLCDRTWVTSASTSAELRRPLAAMPKVEQWIRTQIVDFQRENGVGEPVDPLFSPTLVLAFTTAALLGDTGGFPAHYVFTGPALPGHASERDDGFPWHWLDPDRQHVFVSLGTLNAEAGNRFFRTITDGLADLGERVQLIMVAPSGAVADPPPHVLTLEHVPQLALLRRLDPRRDAVISHGGHNTVCETLAQGLPLVVAPIRDDQPIVAQQVADAGAGIRVRFGRLRPSQVRDAVLAVLDDADYRRAAATIAESFTAAGGAPVAADHLEKLPCSTPVSP